MPDPNAPEPTAAADGHATPRAWWVTAGVAVAFLVAYLVVPAEQSVLRNLVLYPAVDVVAVLAVVVGVRRYRPRARTAWYLIAAGLASFTVADLVYGVFQVQGTDPFPSVADVFYLVAYPLFAAGLHVATRARAPEVDRGLFIDAAMITVTAGMFAFLVVARVYWDDPALDPLSAAVASAYPLADVLLLSLTVRLLFAANWRTRALQLLAGGLALLLVGDVVYTVGALFLAPGDSDVVDAMLLVGALTIGLAGLHPSMVELTRELPDVPVPRYTTVRVVSLYLISLVPVVVLAAQALEAEARHAWIPIVALVLLCSLVVARFIDLAAQTRRAAARAVTLNRFSSALPLLTGRDALLRAAAVAAQELVGEGRVTVLPGRAGPTGHRVFVDQVQIDGHTVATLVAEADASALRSARDGLQAVVQAVSLALERDALLTAQRELALHLAAQNEQLRELDRMKDQLVGVVSHELRTPLAAMTGYMELLLDGDAGELEAEQRTYAEVVGRNIRRLNRLVDDLLFMSRVDAGRMSLERSWVDVAEVAAASVETVRARADQAQVAVDLTVSGELPRLWADGSRLAQLFDNLVSNAVKFTPAGGAVHVVPDAASGGVSIEVADTGIGVPADELDRLFERFFRTSTVGAVGGTGLGLSIVKSIVDMHDGTITVRSTQGVGTTFRVELPVLPDDETQRP